MTVDNLKMRYSDKLKEKEFEYVPRSDYQKIRQENQQAQFELQKITADYNEQIQNINESWDEKYRQLEMEKNEEKSRFEQSESEIQRLKMSIEESNFGHKNQVEEMQSQINQMIGQNVFLEQKLREGEHVFNDMKKLKTKYSN